MQDNIEAIEARLGSDPVTVLVNTWNGQRLSPLVALLYVFVATCFPAAAGIGAMAVAALFTQQAVVGAGVSLGTASVLYVLVILLAREKAGHARVVYTGDIREVLWNDNPASLLAPPQAQPPVAVVLEAMAEVVDGRMPRSAEQELATFLRKDTMNGAGMVGGLSVGDSAEAGQLSAAQQASKASRQRT